MQKCIPKILRLINKVPSKDNEGKEKDHGFLEEDFTLSCWKERKDSELTYSLLDYRPLIFEKFISNVL